MEATWHLILAPLPTQARFNSFEQLMVPTRSQMRLRSHRPIIKNTRHRRRAALLLLLPLTSAPSPVSYTARSDIRAVTQVVIKPSRPAGMLQGTIASIRGRSLTSALIPIARRVSHVKTTPWHTSGRAMLLPSLARARKAIPPLTVPVNTRAPSTRALTLDVELLSRAQPSQSSAMERWSAQWACPRAGEALPLRKPPPSTRVLMMQTTTRCLARVQHQQQNMHRIVTIASTELRRLAISILISLCFLKRSLPPYIPTSNTGRRQGFLCCPLGRTHTNTHSRSTEHPSEVLLKRDTRIRTAVQKQLASNTLKTGKAGHLMACVTASISLRAEALPVSLNPPLDRIYWPELCRKANAQQQHMHRAACFRALRGGAAPTPATLAFPRAGRHQHPCRLPASHHYTEA